MKLFLAITIVVFALAMHIEIPTGGGDHSGFANANVQMDGN